MESWNIDKVHSQGIPLYTVTCYCVNQRGPCMINSFLTRGLSLALCACYFPKNVPWHPSIYCQMLLCWSKGPMYDKFNPFRYNEVFLTRGLSLALCVCLFPKDQCTVYKWWQREGALAPQILPLFGKEEKCKESKIWLFKVLLPHSQKILCSLSRSKNLGN